jgi:thimet oligopeptidase
MYHSKYLITILACLVLSPVWSQSPGNPLLVQSNNPIAFDKVDAGVIRGAVAEVILRSNGRLKKIISVVQPGGGPGNTLQVFDKMFADINDLGMKLQLISVTYTQDSTRNAADNGNQELQDYSTSLTLNESLYKTLKTYSDLSGSSIKPNQKKFLAEQLQYFENNGMKLDSAGRAGLQKIQDKITILGIAFDHNIAASVDSIVFFEKDMGGIPENRKSNWKRQSGAYVVYVNTPNYTDLTTFASSEDTRKVMYNRYNNRAYPQNVGVLDSLLYYRNLYAHKLGYKSYAAYALTTKMAANPKTVWNFANELVAKLKPGLTSDLRELKTIKHQINPELRDTLFAWDINYYNNKRLESQYHLNSEEVKEYFEMNQTIAGMFEVYHRLFGIAVKETHGMPTWFNKVRSFNMYVGTKKVGSFYFDLYPRKNKYTHFACFPTQMAQSLHGTEILPVATLVCNFPEGGPGSPTLLNHSDVVILFHEFGHLVADMVGRSDLISQPYTLKGDFVEAPSQFLENFCWQYASLKIFAKNYKTGATLPDSLFKKMKATENVLGAYLATRQFFLAMVDLTFEDKYDSIRGMDLTAVSKNLWSINQIPFPDGTHFITSFTHLNGYGANYYGYQWSKVYAKDIFSEFEKNGVMDSKTGERYRKEILEVAGSREETDLLLKFLGRQPNSDAYMHSMGL